MKELKELHRKLVELSKRKLGYSTGEVPGHSVEEVGRATSDLQRWGHVHPGKRGHRTVRYFACPQDAKAWADAGSRPPTVRQEPMRAPWPADTPGVENENTLFTFGPSPQGRVLRSNTHGQW